MLTTAKVFKKKTFEYAISVLVDRLCYLNGLRTAQNNIDELQQAIQILEKAGEK